jgi:beta-N-acetylhexosaminidase
LSGTDSWHDSRVTDRPISRRDLLKALALGSTAVALAACAPGTGSPQASPASTTQPPGSPSAAPSASASTPAASASPGLTLREKIAGLMIVGFRGSTLADTNGLAAAIRDANLGGVILFDRDQATGGVRNVISPPQVTRLVADLRAAAGDRRLIVSIDQEGGIVTRLSPAHGFPAVASEAEIGAADDAAAAATWGAGIATTLASVGINLNFAPVVDLNVNPKSPAIGALDRSFSADPDVVVAMATQEIEAHRAAGVGTTLKHFPGIGSSTTNTDFGVADVTATWTRVELEPFRRLIAAGTADLVMAGHVVNGQLDPDYPASLSKKIVTDLLRGELGWTGPVVTDDLQAAAIVEQFGFDEAVVLALEAGNDLLLFANQQAYDPDVMNNGVDAIVAAVDAGRLPALRIDEALDRVDRLLGAISG